MFHLKRALVVALTSAGILVPVTLAAGSAAAHDTTCSKTYTLPMFRRAARRVYAGSRLPHRGAYGHLWRYALCQRPPSTEVRARRVWHRQLVAWAARRRPSVARSPSPGALSYATVSWYYDSGQTASGFHAFYGVAACGSGGGPCLAFGTHVTFCLHGCVRATVDDHGPYVPGRAWDLNQNTARAIGFDGVGSVGYRIG